MSIHVKIILGKKKQILKQTEKKLIPPYYMPT